MARSPALFATETELSQLLAIPVEDVKELNLNRVGTWFPYMAKGQPLYSVRQAREKLRAQTLKDMGEL